VTAAAHARAGAPPPVCYRSDMLRRLLVVAIPDDLLGRLAGWAARILAILLLLGTLLGRVPAAWSAFLFGSEWAVRALLALASLWIADAAGTVLASRIPAAPYVIGRRLALPTWGLPRHLSTRDLDSVRIERRPDPWGETIVIRLHDGRQFDLCPLRWKRADLLYERLRKATHRGRTFAASVGRLRRGRKAPVSARR